MLKANIKEAARSLYSSKQRTILALIGIIIGIGSVIAMVSIGKIVQAEAIRQFKDMGTDILAVRRSAIQGYTPAAQLKDALAIPVFCPGVSMVAPYSMGGGNTSYAGHKIENSGVIGVTQSFFDLNKLKVRKGRALSDLDEFSHYCVVGNAISEEMFLKGADDVIGAKIKINDTIFTVVGMLEKVPKGGLRSFDANPSLYINITTALRASSEAQISAILAKVRPGTNNSEAQAQIKEYFPKYTKVKNLFVTSPEEIIAQMEKQMKLYTLLLGAIGSISLIVGGVGVMNVMLVSVTERRREIGIRRALGAKRRYIRRQFLIESMILSMIGGVLGIALGVGSSYIISFFAKWQFGISYSAILLGVGVSSSVGIFFGFYPAHQASKLDPIIALRAD